MGKRPAMTVLRSGSARMALVGLTGALACASAAPAPQPEPAPPPATPVCARAILTPGARDRRHLRRRGSARRRRSSVWQRAVRSGLRPSCRRAGRDRPRRARFAAARVARIVRGPPIQRDERRARRSRSWWTVCATGRRARVPSRIIAAASPRPACRDERESGGRQQNRRIEIELRPEPAALEGGGSQ
jgi:hypothetical protein